MSAKDHYETLGIQRTEDESGIRTAFRQLAKRYHPDLTGPEETRHFQEILEAYAVLSDPASRASYNESLCKREATVAFKANTRYSEPRQTFDLVGSSRAWSSISPREGMRGFSIHGIHDLFFNDFAGLGFAHRGLRGRRVLDVVVQLSREEARRGGILPLWHPGLVRCRFCGGMDLDQAFVCTSCHARGTAGEDETFRAGIPAGIRDGSTLDFTIGDHDHNGVLLRLHIQVSDT